jgi:hypothetical protein
MTEKLTDLGSDRRRSSLHLPRDIFEREPLGFLDYRILLKTLRSRDTRSIRSLPIRSFRSEWRIQLRAKVGRRFAVRGLTRDDSMRCLAEERGRRDTSRKYGKGGESSGPRVADLRELEGFQVL